MSQRRLKKLRAMMTQKEVKSVDELGINEVAYKGISEILRENWKFLLVLVLGIMILFWNGQNGAFVSDDYATIPQNPLVADVGYNLSNKDSQNLVTLSNTFIAVLFGVVNTFPFHFYSLLVYLVICCIVFVFIYQLIGKYEAMITTVIFSVHPIHVEAVTWISGKPYLLSTLFILLTLINFKGLVETGKKKYLLMTVLMTLLAYKSEGARSLTIFILIPLLLIYQGIKRTKISLRTIILSIIIVTSTIVIIIWPRVMTRINVVNSGYNASESLFYNPFFQYPTSIAKYLQLLLVPIDLTLYHTMYTFPVWLNWAVSLSYSAAVIYFFFKNKKIFFALMLIFLATATSMAPVKVSWLVAERYMFFGSLGFCLFLSLILLEIFKKNAYVAVSILSLVLVLFSFRTYLRNNDWNTNHNLWVNTCQVSPNSHNAWNNIGDDYDKLKDYDDAIKGFTQSTLIKSNYADAYHNRANIFFKIGRLDLARDSYNTALYYSPVLYQTYISLTQIDLIEKNFILAEQHAKKTIELQPNNPQAGYVLAVVYAQTGKKEESKSVLEAILRSFPDYQLAKDLLLQISTI